ncbi:hypothetical protein IWQ60_009332 [Tieghemiomyces parasiticus]|uniref:Uncharacterized protein n=1 Tax=Tieghemiomyces parasiticus TaxID=78921 RepID=A0A9W8DLB8_9FUNG|nr:hypothetical protein IWQ60_009332 [Tieghemiomyces parasiticus]
MVYQIRKKSFLNKTLVITDGAGRLMFEKRQRGFFKTKKGLFNAQTNEVMWEMCNLDNTVQSINLYGPHGLVIKLRTAATHSLCPLTSLIGVAHHSFCWDADHYNWIPSGNGSTHNMKCYRAATGCEVAEFIVSPIPNSGNAVGALVIHAGKEYRHQFCEFLLFSLICIWETIATSPPALGAEPISFPSSYYQGSSANSSTYLQTPLGVTPVSAEPASQPPTHIMTTRSAAFAAQPPTHVMATRSAAFAAH